MTKKDKVIEFISEFCNMQSNELNVDTLLFDDLGIDGYDGIELFEKFSVDLEELNVSDYFGPEGLPIWFLFYWVILLVKRILGQSAHEAAGLKPLPISRLIAAVEKGKW